VVGVAGKPGSQVSYRLDNRRVRARSAFVASFVREFSEGDARLLVLVPHSLLFSKEGSSRGHLDENLVKNSEFFREFMDMLKEAKVEEDSQGKSLDEFLAERGMDLSRTVRMVPVEGVGRWQTSSGSAALFRGNPTWLILRMALTIEEELKHSNAEKLVLDLTHGHNVYLLPLYMASELAVRSSPMYVELDISGWESPLGRPREGAQKERYPVQTDGGKGPDLSEMKELKELRAAFELSERALGLMTLRGSFEIPKDLMERIKDLKHEWKKAIYALEAFSCALTAPMIPLLHLSILEIDPLSTEIGLSSPEELEASFSYNEGSNPEVIYRYRLRGRDLEDPIEGLISYLMSRIGKFVREKGLVPEDCRIREKIQLPGGEEKELELQLINEEWIKKLYLWFNSANGNAQKNILCVELGGRIIPECLSTEYETVDEHKRLTMYEGIKENLEKQLNENKDKPAEIKIWEYYCKKIRGNDKKCWEVFKEATKNMELDGEQIRHFGAHAGMIHTVVLLARMESNCREMKLYYNRGIIERMLKDDQLLAKVCPRMRGV